MTIETRTLNHGEKFCCSQKSVKSIFCNHDISINFGAFSRHYDESGMPKAQKHDGKIVAVLRINNRDIKPNYFPNSAWPSLSFYVLKEEEVSKESEAEFVSKILPKLYEIFLKNKDYNPDKTSGYYVVLVELLNNKFIVHERIKNC